MGTYNKQPEVRIETKEGILYIQTIFGEAICEHRISSGRGLLIQSKNHTRDRTTALDKLQNDLDARLEHRAAEFLQAIRTEKARYSRDQFRIIQSMIDQHGVPEVLEAVDFLPVQQSQQRQYFKGLSYPQSQGESERSTVDSPPVASIIPVADAKYHVTTQKRPLDVYAKVGVR